MSLMLTQTSNHHFMKFCFDFNDITYFLFFTEINMSENLSEK